MQGEIPEDTLVVYSDYVCPFCYLGKASLETYLDQAEDPPPVTWRAFDLRWHKRRADGSIDPDVPDGKDEAYYERAKRNVRRLAREYDVDMTLDLPEDIDAWNAHKASIHVLDEHGQAAFERFHDAVFDALWREGRDVGDPDVLADVAEAVDLPPDEVRQAADDDALDEAVRDRFERSHRQGITGVPTFVYNDLRLPGAIPPEQIGTLVDNG